MHYVFAVINLAYNSELSNSFQFHKFIGRINKDIFSKVHVLLSSGNQTAGCLYLRLEG